MRNALNVFVAVIVLVIGGAIGWNVVQEQRARLKAEAEEAQRKPVRRQTALRPVTPPPAAQQAPPRQAAKTTAKSTEEQLKAAAATPPPPPRKYTWQEIEDELAKLRSERPARPEAQHELANWYDRIAEPEFTTSSDVPEHCAKLAQWREEFPDSPVPLIALARAHIKHAWEARGPGFANSVRSEGWELFHTRIAEARRLLEAALQKGVADGAAHCALLAVVKDEGASKEQALAVLEEGRKLDPTYYELYSAMAEYLLPRWHGEPGDIERFAAEMAKAMPSDDGLEAYAYIALHAARREREALFWGEFDPDLLARSGKVLAKRHPTNHMLSGFAAYIAWINQDHAEAQRLHQIIGDNPDPRLWREHEAQIWREWCRAMALPDEPAQRAWGGLGYRGRIAFSADGRGVWCGSGLYFWPVHLIDLETGKPSARLPGSGFAMRDVQFDGRRRWVFGPMASGPVEGVALWKLDDPYEPIFLPTPGACTVAVVNPERDEIAVWYGQTLAILDVETRAPRARIELSSPASRVLYSPDGKLLATSGQQFSVWDAATGEKRHDLATIHNSEKIPELNCKSIVALDDDGCVLAIADGLHFGDGNRYLVKYSADGQTIAKVREQPMPRGFWLSPDKRLLASLNLHSGDAPTRIELSDAKTGKVIQEIEAHWGSLYGVAFAEDNRLLAALGEDGIISAWSIGGDAEKRD